MPFLVAESGSTVTPDTEAPPSVETTQPGAEAEAVQEITTPEPEAEVTTFSSILSTLAETVFGSTTLATTTDDIEGTTEESTDQELGATEKIEETELPGEKSRGTLQKVLFKMFPSCSTFQGTLMN